MSQPPTPSNCTPYLSGRIQVHPVVFSVSALLILLFVVFTLLNLEQAKDLFNSTKSLIATNMGWLFILLVQLFLLFCVYLACSRFAHVRLGGVNARPDYSRFTWFAMLFSAGMGIGLMFWSVAEPIYHLTSPPIPVTGVAAAKLAMSITFLHWGLHAWAIYAVMGLSLAYFSFNHKLPLTIRSAFYPLLGERVNGPIGNIIDIIAVVATLFGVATSLGLGVAQVNAGLQHLFGLPMSTHLQLVLIAVITAIATTSVVSGINKGIKLLSEINLLMAFVLMLFLLLVGPTLFLLNGLVQNTGYYVQNLLELSSWTETYQRDASWQASWTIFYWAWWIAWSPFVGMFIARISRGRTIREFILGVLLVPTALTFLWMTVFGGTAIFQELQGVGGIADAVHANVATALFALLEQYPLASFASVIAIILVVVFFVTSSDSGSLVIDIITSGGNLNPPVAQRIFWAVSEGVVAAVLLLGGGLLALQTASVVTGLPFAIILALMCLSLHKALRHDVPPPQVAIRRAPMGEREQQDSQDS